MSQFISDNVLVEIIADDNGTNKTFYIRAETDSTTSGGGKRINKLYIDTGTTGHPSGSTDYIDWVGLFEDTSLTTSNNYLANPGIDVGFFYITSNDINQATGVNNENTLSNTSNDNNIKEIKIHYPYLIFDSNIVKSTNQYNVTIDFSPINNLGTEDYTLLSAEGTTSTISLYKKNTLFDLSKSLLKNGTATDIINFIGNGSLGGPKYNNSDDISKAIPVYDLISRIKKIIIIYKGEKGLPINSGSAHSSPNLSFHKTSCIKLGLNNNLNNNLGVIGSNTDNIPLFLWEFSSNTQSLVSDPNPNNVNTTTTANFNYDFYPFSIFDNTGIRAKINETTQGTQNASISVGNPIIGRNTSGTTSNYNLSSTSDNYFNTNYTASTFDSNADDNLLEDNLVIKGVSVQDAYDDLKSSFSREIIGNSIEVPTADSLEIKGGVVGSNAISCFVAEEVVETDQGLVKIKDITKKHSIRGMRVKYLSKITIKHSYIVKINKHAFGENRPNKDTLCSPRHGIYLNDNDTEFVVLQNLVNNNTITKVDINKNTDLYNILLEDNIHSYMYVNNLKVETLHPSNPTIPIISSKKYKKL